MATQKMFSIRDIKGEIFHPPFFKPSHGEAERVFLELQKDEKSTISKYPEDFSLWYLGTYDDQTGLMEAKQPSHMTNTKPSVASV